MGLHEKVNLPLTNTMAQILVPSAVWIVPLRSIRFSGAPSLLVCGIS